MSENRSGLFFDMSKISDEVFADLLQFREFVNQNSTELRKRDGILDSLARSAPVQQLKPSEE